MEVVKIEDRQKRAGAYKMRATAPDLPTCNHLLKGRQLACSAGAGAGGKVVVGVSAGNGQIWPTWCTDTASCILSMCCVS